MGVTFSKERFRDEEHWDVLHEEATTAPKPMSHSVLEKIEGESVNCKELQVSN